MSNDEIDLKKFVRTTKDLEVDKMFRAVVKLEGSDLHLRVGNAPYVRIEGTLRPIYSITI